MPTYDYKCANCGRFEWFQKITEEPLTVCPHCGGEVQRQISRNVGIIFKGSGFYTTDNRKPSQDKESTHSSATSEQKVS
ncbi:MAG: FmdB family transcriptional regulator [Firmicutes bacterium]|nr:FmdB family transcriptional regulator [Bacillota bacterium]